ncbi:RHS repeat-associated core domain-containing protein [Pyruvatibacter sp.]|uniref:RHS repeat-associated core domain-containing protein n=1 Tax=Pyruvatibacter sp. TaxID=1981328 RepID=UPI003265C822
MGRATDLWTRLQNRFARMGMSAAGALLAALVLTSATITSASATPQTRITAFEYDAVTGLLTKEIIEPDTPAERLETTYTHDAYGNRVKTTVDGIDIAVRESEVAFDSQGRFVEWAENALNHREERDFHPGFGTVTRLKGPNDLTTTWTYDQFGRKDRETRADGTYSEYEYYYCDGVAGGSHICPTGGAYVLVSYLKDSLGAFVGSPQKIYYDKLERVIRKEELGFNGVGPISIFVDTEYNSLGQVHRVSEPYFDVLGATPDWTTNTYDILGRLVGQTLPDGTTISNTFSGLTGASTTANAAATISQTRTETKNARGNVVEVKDNRNKITTYEYDAFDNLTKVTDAAGNITTTVYDDLGRRTSLTAPDLGTTVFSYNVAGELLTETDAKSQVAEYTYDLLGRMTLRIDKDSGGTKVNETTWVYDTASKGLGKLTETSTETWAGGVSYVGYKRSHTYDTLGRVGTTSVEVDEGDIGTALTTGTFTFGYDSGSRLHTVQYPSPLNLTVEYLYNECGHLIEVKNQTVNKSVWKATALDARDQVLTEQFGEDGSGNAVVTSVRTYDVRGWLTGIDTDGAGAGLKDVQELSYIYDYVGNVTEREDKRGGTNGFKEDFLYDPLNRLTSAEVTQYGGGGPDNVLDAQTASYDDIGNITFKSDVGNYSYLGAGGPHAVAAITPDGVNGAVNATFTYDANGNMLSGHGRTVNWTTFNKPADITRGGSTLDFTYGSDRQRTTQKGPDDTTYYMSMGGTAHLERIVDASTGQSKYQVYISASGRLVSAFTRQENAGAPADEITRYYHDDNLGSVSVITDENGNVVERLSYDAWGERRDEDGSPNAAITSETNRGFTRHEHLEEVDLVHMNGRVYDAQIGRFLSADPHVQDPFNTQNLNRYSYVLNNPLAYTDPDGFFFKKLFRAIKNVFKAIVRAVRRSPIFRTILTIGLTVALGPGSWGLSVFSTNFAAGIAASAIVGGITDGVEGALLGAARAAVTYGIGREFDLLKDAAGNLSVGELAGKAAVHSVTSGAFAVAQGGEFGPAALSGGFSVFVGGWADQEFGFERIEGFVAHSIIGGTASVIGGGKFQNGAASGAFIWWYNAQKGGAKGLMERAGDAQACLSPASCMPSAHGGMPYRGGMNSMSRRAEPEVASPSGTVRVSRSRHPEAARHIDDAIAAGHPSTLTVSRAGASARRREALSGTRPSRSTDRDEYPPAMFREGGKGSSVRNINPADNRGAGACIGRQCSRYPDGSTVKIEVVD